MSHPLREVVGSAGPADAPVGEGGGRGTRRGRRRRRRSSSSRGVGAVAGGGGLHGTASPSFAGGERCVLGFGRKEGA